MPVIEHCTHQGARPLIWHHHDPEEFIDWCRCQDCGELVATEPPDPLRDEDAEAEARESQETAWEIIDAR